MTSAQTGDVTIVAIRGDVDGQTAGEAQQYLTPLLKPESKLVLDLGEVDFLSSAGLRVLLSLYRQLAQVKGRLVLTGLSDDLQHTLTITGLLRYLPAYETREAGVAALS